MGTVSFEVPGPGTYQVQCDPSLTPLTNPAAAGDVLAGKRFYNDQSQAVTGTIATKGASDVTADGPLVAVPPGYYPQAVNKTVSDPDLVPGNIKAGVDIFGVTGSLTSSFSAVLVVTVDSGAEVTATDGTTTLTAISTGTATFHLPNGGTWTVSATLNGSQAAPATVEVQENFSMALSAGASQSVTVPTQYEAELSFTPSRLPDGYTEVEYISNPNLGYIADTPYTITPFYNTRYEIIADIISLPDEESYLWGKSYSYILNSKKSSRAEALSISANQSIVKCYSSYSSTSQYTATPKEISFTGSSLDIVVDNPKGYFQVNGVRETIDVLGNSSQILTKPSLFACHYYLKSGPILQQDIPGYKPANYKLKSLKIYSSSSTDTGDLLYEYVPCIDPNGDVGVYELVNGVFAKSSDDMKPFVSGPAV